MSEEDYVRLASQVEQLEAKSKQQSSIVRVCFLAIVLTLGVLIMRELPGVRLQARELRVKTIKIVNDTGATVAQIGSSGGKGGGAIFLRDGQGNERASWVALKDGGLLMFGDGTCHGVSLTVTRSMADLVLVGDDSAMAWMRVQKNSPSIELYGEDDKNALFKVPEKEVFEQGKKPTQTP